jgi:hypothetical protein
MTSNQFGENESTQFRSLLEHVTAQQTALWDTASDAVGQKRFYDFKVWSERKQIENLRYMHRNPVKRGLVDRPEQWEWSSFRAYLYGETGLVCVKFQEWALEIKGRPVAVFGDGKGTSLTLIRSRPLIRKERE